MTTTDDEAFNQFVNRWKKKLRGIAYKTAGEQQYEDVVQEAWLMAHTLRADDGSSLDLCNETHQQRLLAYLYQQIIRYTEVTVRHAVRFEHAPSGCDDGEDVHPLTRTLASDAGRNVLDALLEREADQSLEVALQAHGSLAAAYVRLLRHFDNRMDATADHLRISVSYAYRRCARARCLAEHLQHISVPGTDILPGPWRRYRLIRQPIQLTFDFDEGLPLE
jgi:DNA-directed RNA polymerase specialized sigma24 family protein